MPSKMWQKFDTLEYKMFSYYFALLDENGNTHSGSYSNLSTGSRQTRANSEKNIRLGNRMSVVFYG
jgi:hypothetical protein